MTITHLQASAVQRQFWLTQVSAPTSAAYNIPSAFLLEGAIDAEKFKASIESVVSDWEILRSTYDLVDGEVVQNLGTTSSLFYSKKTVRSSSRKDFLTAIEVEITEQSRHCFNLRSEHPIRIHWFEDRDNDRAAVLINIHHIAVDLRSKTLFSNAIQAYYTGEQAANKDVTDYQDYCIHEDNWLNGPAADKQERFWKEKLAPVSHTIPLHQDKTQYTGDGTAGRFCFDWDDSITSNINAFCEAYTTKPYLVLQAAYYATLYKYTGCEDFVMAVPLSNRRNKEFQDTFGCFVNTLPVVPQWNPQAGFAAMVLSTRQAMLQTHRNQELPIERIVASVKPHREDDRNPLYQVGFTHEPYMSLTLPGIACTPIDCFTGDAQIELFLRLTQINDRHITGQLEYERRRFPSTFAERFMSSMLTLLQEALENPDRPINELSFAPPSDLVTLDAWNETDKIYNIKPLARSFEEQVERTPEATALWYQGETTSYHQLNERANTLARRLLQAGVKPGDKVAMMLWRGVDMVASIYAILKVGAGYVPLEPDYPLERLSFMIEDAEPSCLLVSNETERFAKDLSVTKLITDDSTESIDSTAELPEVAITDTAYAIYTSGSTGKPKGVLNNHAGVANYICWLQDTFPLEHGEVVLLKTPYSFDVSVSELFWPLQVGATLAIAPAGVHRDPVALAETMNAADVTTINFVPSLLDAFVAFKWATALPKLKRVLACGEELSRDLNDRFFERFPHVELHNVYGPTEAAVMVTHYACRANESLPFVPIGKPFTNTQMYVLDKCNNRVPIGVPGEVCIGGIQVAQGYWKRPELTQERFIPDQFRTECPCIYRTGDLGMYQEDGNLRYLGRLDFQVKIRGNRIELGEIETRLREHHDVHEVVVVAQSIAGGPQSLVAYVTGTETEMSTSIEQLKAHCAETMPDYMVPNVIVVLAELPHLPNGKINRKALPAVQEAMLTKGSTTAPPRNALEKKLSQIWCELLELPEVGIHDNFMDLGGNSLTLTKLYSELHPEYGDKIDLVSLFKHTTIAKLSAVLAKPTDSSQTNAQAKPAQAIVSRAAQAKAAMAARRKANRGR